MTNLSLYELIKQEYQKKGRPLKIISDWDECLQAFNAFVLYNSVKENENRNFTDYFRDFSENKEVEMDFSDTVAFAKYKGEFRDERLKNLQKQPNGIEKIKQEFKEFKEKDNFYEKLPFLSISKDLLLALKEELIKELVIVSASNGIRKDTKFKKTFGLFPNAKLFLEKTMSVSPNKKPRQEWIKDEHPDFDIFIDDSLPIISNASKNMPSKLYVFPDYKCNRSIQKPNIYRVKQEVSDLKDEDFVKGAEEYKAKKAYEVLQPEQKNYLPWIIGSLVSGGLIVGLIIWLVTRKKKAQKEIIENGH